MTTLLKRAFDKASKLTAKAQKELAEELLEDLESELKWRTAFEKNEDKLEILAKEALEEFKAGKTKKMGFDDL